MYSKCLLLSTFQGTNRVYSSLGDLSEGCLSTGVHYNPYDRMHGGPRDKERHVGDLGNIKSDSNGYAIVDISDEAISLHSPQSIVG